MHIRYLSGNSPCIGKCCARSGYISGIVVAGYCIIRVSGNAACIDLRVCIFALNDGACICEIILLLQLNVGNGFMEEKSLNTLLSVL